MKRSIFFILDHNPLHRNLISYRLVSSGISNVYTLSSPEECLYRMEKGVIPDFLIADYFTAAKSDKHFLEKVNSFSVKTKVIFFSDMDNHEIATGLIEQGAADYIMKTKSLNDGINELMKNLKYLRKEEVYSGL